MEQQRLRGLLDRYGECIIYGKHPVLRKMLEREQQRERGILEELRKGVREACGQPCTGETFEREKEVRMRLEEIGFLQEIINEV